MAEMPVLIIETVYSPPDDDEADWCPDEGEPWIKERKVTFRELVRLIENEGFRNPSSFPVAVPSYRDWLNAETEQDMRTGELVERSLHLSPSAPQRMRKYWGKAWKAARVRFTWTHGGAA